jgi:hypothetical protein
MERLVAYLSYSRRLGKLFSGPSSLLLRADPVVQNSIIREAELRVYGSEGLDRYEEREKSRLNRLTRRSLAQHLCQRALIKSVWINVLRRIGFGFAFPFLAVFLFIKTRMNLKTSFTEPLNPDIVIFFWAGRLDKFVRNGMFAASKIFLHRHTFVYLSMDEIRFFLRAVLACPRMFICPELLCNFLRWLAYYGYVVHRYHPKVVANFFEGTASSSLMTAYLGERGIRHLDIQHGELFYTAESAFCEFDEVRLWGEYFKKIFIWHRSPVDTIMVTGTVYHRELFHNLRSSLQPRPKRLLIIDPFLYEAETYYASLLRILKQMDAQWEIRVRRHPADRRVCLAYVGQLNADLSGREGHSRIEEELPETASIEEAIGKSRAVVGIASAALLEAWISGCKVIHLKDGPCQTVLMERYQGSENVLYYDEEVTDVMLKDFLTQPATLNEHEDCLVNDITMLEKS